MFMLVLCCCRFKESEDVILAALEPLKQSSEIQTMQWEAKLTVLLAKNFSLNPQKGNDQAIKAYQRAYDIQTRFIIIVTSLP